MWALLEPIHAVTYFAPECTEEFKRAGLKGFWMGYFAGRSAPMGEPGPALVTAVFYNFAPAMVKRALPDAWGFASRNSVLDARLGGADRTLRRLLGSAVDSVELKIAAELSRRAAEGISVEGRPLAAANAALEWPAEPSLVLWQAATTLREHRGDGHVVALNLAGLDGCGAHVSMAATGVVPRSTLQPNRGWSDDEWASAQERLREKGWIDEEGRATELGVAQRRKIENLTDGLASGPWAALGKMNCDRLEEILAPLTLSVFNSGVIPAQNPIGLPVE